jgi:hypothetical protein
MLATFNPVLGHFRSETSSVRLTHLIVCPLLYFTFTSHARIQHPKGFSTLRVAQKVRFDP